MIVNKIYIYLFFALCDVKIKLPINYLINENINKYKFLEILSIFFTHLPKFQYEFIYNYSENNSHHRFSLATYTPYNIPEIYTLSNYIAKKNSLVIVNNYNKYILYKKLIATKCIIIDHTEKYLNLLEKHISKFGIDEYLNIKLHLEKDKLSLLSLREQLKILEINEKHGTIGSVVNFSKDYWMPFLIFKFKEIFIFHSFSINQLYLEFIKWMDNVNFFWQFAYEFSNKSPSYSFHLNTNSQLLRNYNQLLNKIKKKYIKIYYSIERGHNCLLEKKILQEEFQLLKKRKYRLNHQNVAKSHMEYKITVKMLKIIEKIHNIDNKISEIFWTLYLELVPLTSKKRLYFYGTNLTVKK